jgi:hypothetical protein
MTTTTDFRRTLVVIAAALIAPVSAAAQPAGETGPTASDVLTFLLTNQAVVTDDLVRDRSAALSTRDALVNAVAVALASLPLASSSGGFAYRFNSELGTLERVSDSFGPAFVERALAAPRGRVSVGVSLQSIPFNRLDGAPLEDGVVMISNRFGDEPSAFDVESLVLDMSVTSLTFTASAGLGGGVEVGVAAPFVRLAMSGERTNLYRGQRFRQASGEVTATGIGDIAVRAKYQALRAGSSGIGVAADLRLPTGREEDLLGSGSTTLRLMGIASYERGAFAAHANGSVGLNGAGQGWGAAGAISLAASPRMTISGELMFDRLDNLRGLEPQVSMHPSIAGVETTRLAARSTSGTRALVVAGLKWNVHGPWLMGAQVFWPLTDRGLSAGAAPVVALERAW